MIVDALREDGVAVVRFDELFGPELWADLEADAQRWVASLPPTTPAERRAAFRKSFLVRRFRPRANDPDGERVVLPLDDPWIRFGTGEPVLDAVNEYRGLRAKIIDLENLSIVPDGGEPSGFQRWFRGSHEDNAVQALVYLSEVGPDAGPFEYVRGSQPGGRHGGLFPRPPGAKIVTPPAGELPAGEMLTVTGPPGTTIVADVSGIHRFGHATGRPLLLAYASYLSPEAQRALQCSSGRKFKVDWSSGAGRLSDAARYALE